MRRTTTIPCGSKRSPIPITARGYVDNAGSDNLESSSKTGKTWFKISNAMTPDGQPAGLRYIDFIKVQSAINGSAGGLGELSTEVAGMAVDENLNR